MTKALTACFICLSFLWTGCKKDPVVTTPVVKEPKTPISTDLLAHFSFQPGTYWIYRDSLNGRLDSFYIISNGIGIAITNYRADNGFYYCQMQLNQHNIDGTATADSAVWQYDLHHSVFQLVEYASKSWSTFAEYPFVTGENGISAITPTYTLNGQSFQHIATIDKGTDLFYVNDSVGIIKMRLDQSDTAMPSHVWELKRWNVVK